MWLVQAELESFRNLRKQTVSFHPRTNLVVGRNAQGKTNLLEAIGYLGGLRSFRGAGRPDLIRHGEDHCRVSGKVSPGAAGGGGEATRLLAFSLDARGRSQAADGKRVPLSDYLSAAPAVSFVPEDVGIVAGGPARRRRLLDRSVFELHPAYLAEYRRFHHALRQRNALLRAGRGGRELEAWAGALAEAGSFVLHRRLDLLARLAPAVEGVARELGLEGGVALSYQASFPLPGSPAGERAELEAALRAGLERSLPRERAARRVLAGPHRDDLLFLHGGRDLARTGSQGQKRAAILAFKLGLAAVMGEERGGFPLLLLDDVASELDEARRAALARLVASLPAQVFITMTGDGPGLPFDGPGPGCVLRVADGGIERFEMEVPR